MQTCPQCGGETYGYDFCSDHCAVAYYRELTEEFQCVRCGRPLGQDEDTFCEEHGFKIPVCITAKEVVR